MNCAGSMHLHRASSAWLPAGTNPATSAPPNPRQHKRDVACHAASAARRAAAATAAAVLEDDSTADDELLLLLPGGKGSSRAPPSAHAGPAGPAQLQRPRLHASQARTMQGSGGLSAVSAAAAAAAAAAAGGDASQPVLQRPPSKRQQPKPRAASKLFTDTDDFIQAYASLQVTVSDTDPSAGQRIHALRTSPAPPAPTSGSKGASGSKGIAAATVTAAPTPGSKGVAASSVAPASGSKGVAVVSAPASGSKGVTASSGAPDAGRNGAVAGSVTTASLISNTSDVSSSSAAPQHALKPGAVKARSAGTTTTTTTNITTTTANLKTTTSGGGSSSLNATQQALKPGAGKMKRQGASVRPLRSFEALGSRPFQYSLRLRRRMVAAGYNLPTPIQSHAIPYINAGRDVLAMAHTGTGKTAAYLVPLVGRLMKQQRSRLPRNTSYPAALVLLPTRELAQQVLEDLQSLIQGTHLKAVMLAGGGAIMDQVLAMRGGVDIVVATPGRLIEHLSRNSLKLRRVSLLIVDEADKMLDLGFEPELQRLLGDGQLPAAPKRQTVMLSATLPAPVRQLVQGLLRGPVMVQVGVEGGTVPLIEQRLELMPAAAKMERLLQLLARPPTPTLAPRAPLTQQGPAVLQQGAQLQQQQQQQQQGGVQGGVNVVGAASNASSGALASAAGGPSAPSTSPLLQRPSPTLQRPAAPSAPAASTPTALQRPSASSPPSAPQLGFQPPLGPSAMCVVFTNSVASARKVHALLSSRGLPTSLLHGELPQAARDEAITCFKFGVTSILVATGVASRGLDIPDVGHVLNYDVPPEADEYLHRIGRTGRAGRPGVASTLFTPADAAMAGPLAGVLRASGQAVPAWLGALEVEHRGPVDADPLGAAPDRQSSRPSSSSTSSSSSSLALNLQQGAVGAGAAAPSQLVVGDGYEAAARVSSGGGSGKAFSPAAPKGGTTAAAAAAVRLRRPSQRVSLAFSRRRQRDAVRDWQSSWSLGFGGYLASARPSPSLGSLERLLLLGGAADAPSPPASLSPASAAAGGAPWGSDGAQNLDLRQGGISGNPGAGVAGGAEGSGAGGAAAGLLAKWQKVIHGRAGRQAAEAAAAAAATGGGSGKAEGHGEVGGGGRAAETLSVSPPAGLGVANANIANARRGAHKGAAASGGRGSGSSSSQVAGPSGGRGSGSSSSQVAGPSGSRGSGSSSSQGSPSAAASHRASQGAATVMPSAPQRAQGARRAVVRGVGAAGGQPGAGRMVYEDARIQVSLGP